MQRHKIPRRGGAGVAFLGVELRDAWPLILSIFIALLVGGLLGGGGPAYLGITAGGYFLNRAMVDWKSRQLPGALLEWLYRNGLAGYSKKIKSQQVVYKGDNTVINCGNQAFIKGLLEKVKEHRGIN